jgi:DMSO/TMAO reductase YedYZ molybdopterin-dependent catalytic subunit
VRPPDRLRSMVAAVARSAATFGTDPDRPLHQGRYQSPLRDERLAAWLGAALGVLFTICFVTGLFSHAHQHPLRWFPVPARPAGLYRVTQGLHVAAGIASVPVLLAKLWLVWPRLLSVPPVRRPSDVVERVGLLALVGGGIFMVWTGVANIAQWYPWRFSFTAAHYQVAWITVGGIVAHVGAKWAVARRALAPRWLGRPSRRPRLAEADPVLGTSGEEAHAGLTRRGFLATVAGAGGVLTAVTIGQTVRPLAPLGLLAPRDPRHQPVNRSAANAGVLGAATSPAYRLEITGRVRAPLSLTLDEVRALPTTEAELPIACVEGWSYSARWKGVALSELLRRAGAPPGAAVQVESLEAHSPYRVSYLNRRQAADRDTLLATHLDGKVLSADHGYPVRLIGPGRPGVNQTKWVTRVVVL